MIGIHSQTGQALSGIAHLKQSIMDILLTPVGTRVMRRDYGSNLFELIDAPMNAKTIMDIVAATAEALDRWEPRIKVERVQLHEGAASGRIELTLHGLYLPDGQAIIMDGLVL